MKDGAVVLALVLAAAAFVVRWEHVPDPGGSGSLDLYQYYLPNMLSAAERVRAGGRGLLWNPLNDCGQPFLGVSSTGLFYPASGFFLGLRPDRALLAVVAFNLAVAGVGGFGLGRVLGLDRPGAAALGIAHAFGNIGVGLATWTPVVGSGYAWLPVVLLCVEWSLRRPGAVPAAALGLAVAAVIAAGFPQHVLLAYQLAGLRLLWALVTREPAWPGRAALAVGGGLVLGPLLAAAPLLPSLETARLSVRGRGLAVEELSPRGFLTFGRLRWLAAIHSDVANPLRLTPWMLWAASLLPRGPRAKALFYLVAGLVYLDLAFGLNGHLFAVYESLPLGALFRDPGRFMWMVGFCLAVLTGFAVHAFGAEADHGSRRVGLSLAVLGGLASYWWWTRGGLQAGEWWAAALAVAAALLVHLPRLRPLAGPGLVAALAIDLVVLAPPPARRLVPDHQVLRAHAQTFDHLRTLASAQERVYVIAKHPDLSLNQKTPPLFGLPSVHDYEPQASERWGQYYVMMRVGGPMRSLNTFYFLFGYALQKRRLLDLSAARFVVAGVEADALHDIAGPPLRLRFQDETGVAVYENDQALPRARYVARLGVVPTRETLLQRLAAGLDDPRAVALVEQPPTSSFLGDPEPTAPATVTFTTDEPEHVVLAVEAPRRGFVVLADQHFPGWQAAVNGRPAEIMRADYLFRAVEVPAGRSVVEFRYAPSSVRLGGCVSLLAAAGLVAMLARGRRGAGGGPDQKASSRSSA